MLDSVRNLQAAIRSARTAIGQVGAERVAAQLAKEAVRSLVSRYFGEQRPVLVENGVAEESLTVVDADMQDLLRLTQGRVAKQSYLALLSRLRTESNHLEVRAVSNGGRVRGAQPAEDARDRRILETLDGLAPGAAASYRQGLSDLTSSRVSWRGTAAEFRESLREVLDHLAPDADVESQPGYGKDADSRGPTMAQKTRFILSSRGLSKTASRPAEDAADVVEQTVGNFVRSVYGRSARSTHGQPTREEVARIHSYVQVVLSELLEIE